MNKQDYTHLNTALIETFSKGCGLTFAGKDIDPKDNSGYIELRPIGMEKVHVRYSAIPRSHHEDAVMDMDHFILREGVGDLTYIHIQAKPKAGLVLLMKKGEPMKFGPVNDAIKRFMNIGFREWTAKHGATEELKNFWLSVSVAFTASWVYHQGGGSDMGRNGFMAKNILTYNENVYGMFGDADWVISNLEKILPEFEAGSKKAKGAQA